MLRNERAEVNRLVAESYKRRDQERNDKIQEALEESSCTSNKRHARILRRLQRVEAIIQYFNKLKFARTKNARSDITLIEIASRQEGNDP